ncbi:MAG: hypothetical protein JXR63_13650 [Spirochaetales bacterium]|nr:hypothetical protein [Spirochaetales bacterium]
MKLVGDCYSVIGDVSAFLTKNNIPHISKDNYQVSYNDFYKTSSLSVAELEQRFLPEDPRFDPYLRALPRLFSATSGDQALPISYVKYSRSPLFLYFKLKKIIPSQYSWHIYGFSITQYLLNFVVAIVALFFFLRIATKKNFFASILLVPLFISAFKVPPSLFYLYLINFLFIYFSFSNFAKEVEAYFYYSVKRSPDFFWSILKNLGIFCFFYLVVTIFLRLKFSFFIYSTISLLLILVGYLFFINLKMNRVLLSSHISFMPVSILRRGRIDFSKKYISLVVLFFPLVFFLNWESRLAVPAYSRSLESISSYENLQKAEIDSFLPNSSMYLMHNLYQRNFINEMPWVMPEINQTFTKNNFKLDNGVIKENLINYYVFTHFEYSNIIELFEKDALYKMIGYRQRLSSGAFARNVVVSKNYLHFLAVNVIFLIIFSFYWLVLNNLLGIYKRVFVLGYKEIGQKI